MAGTASARLSRGRDGRIASGNITMRFDGDMLDRLRREANQKRISLNTLASQIFESHNEYVGTAAKAGMVSFQKTLLIRLMNRLSEQEARQLSQEIAKNEMKDIVLIVKRKYTIDAFVEFIESWTRACGFAFSHDVSDNTHHFIIQHDMGKRWSIYFEELFKFTFHDLGAKWADFNTTDNTIMFNIDA